MKRLITKSVKSYKDLSKNYEELTKVYTSYESNAVNGGGGNDIVVNIYVCESISDDLLSSLKYHVEKGDIGYFETCTIGDLLL